MSKESLKVRVDEIREDLKDFLTEEQLKKKDLPGVEGNSLPLRGTFGKYKKAGEGLFKHLRMEVAASEDSVSISNLKIVAPMKGSAPEFGKITKEGSDLKGKLYLKGKTINPKFAQYSELELIAFLEGKNFTAEPVEVQSLTFNDKGYATEAEAKKALVVKGAYLVTITE